MTSTNLSKDRSAIYFGQHWAMPYLIANSLNEALPPRRIAEAKPHRSKDVSERLSLSARKAAKPRKHLPLRLAIRHYFLAGGTSRIAGRGGFAIPSPI
jgi:hypothetical protein